jgi:murein DD-endopeptidase MepM/ murein hydrolase activator NlpD
LFLRNDLGLEGAGGTTALPLVRALPPIHKDTLGDRIQAKIATIDWAPDLGSQIGSATWWRGVATCASLIAITCYLSPGLHRTVPGDVPAALGGAQWDEARAQAITPLAWGANTGRRMASNDLVVPLAETPERPQVSLTATLGEGDTFTGVLKRAGASKQDADAVAKLVSGAVALGDIASGTQIDMTLGRRPDKTVARPLEQIAFRARFDLAVSLTRAGDNFTLDRHPIAIDHTPLRIEGRVGSNLYRSVRAAGVSSQIAESYTKALATRLSVGHDVHADDRFDVIVAREHAATGETKLGNLLFAGLDQGKHTLQLMKWSDGEWYEANGQRQTKGFMGMPVNGRISSNFGMRFHPILHYTRMHKGIDIACHYGSPVYAVLDGRVTFAGHKGGYGNFIAITGGNIGTGYGHLSRIAVRAGTHVRPGQLVGYSGNSGLSTGPHLHFETYRNGQAVNPRGFSFASVSALSGAALQKFKAEVASLLAVKPAQ